MNQPRKQKGTRRLENRAANQEACEKVKAPISVRSARRRGGLIEDLCFDELIVGKANKLAQSVAIDVAMNPDRNHNPLVVYGRSGVGKTHLLHAIGNLLIERDPEISVRYVHSDDFYSEVVKAYQQKTFDHFKNSYRDLDVLLIDDVQSFNGKDRTQEEFYLAIRALESNGKQIIVSSDRHPMKLAGIDKRLMNRLSKGLVVKMKRPGKHMRIALLKHKAAMAGIELSEEVIGFLARHVRSSVFELEGTLKLLAKMASHYSMPIDTELVKKALKIES